MDALGKRNLKMLLQWIFSENYWVLSITVATCQSLLEQQELLLGLDLPFLKCQSTVLKG